MFNIIYCSGSKKEYLKFAILHENGKDKLRLNNKRVYLRVSTNTQKTFHRYDRQHHGYVHYRMRTFELLSHPREQEDSEQIKKINTSE